MRLVNIKQVKSGQRLARAILSAEGTMLLGKGVELTPAYIKRLRELGVYSIYIADERFPNLQIKDIISESTRRESIKITQKLTEKIKQEMTIESPQVFQAVNSIIDELLNQENILLNLVDIRTHDNYAFSHSVNICVLSLLVGASLHYDQIKLRNLGIGALLHDLGKVTIPFSALGKNLSLTAEEFKKLKGHCDRGYELVRLQREFSIHSAHVALQHHERYDGTGYPQGLRGEEIHEFARIVGIVDIYDTLSTDRSYRNRYLPHEIYEYLMSSCYTSFDPKLTALFLKHVPPYPKGTIVQLNTKEKAIVTGQNVDCLVRPIVRVFEQNQQPINPPLEYDLLDNPTILIEDVIKY